MSEYWKSQPRKFCPQCKCWIADNKISVQFHEGGKRHKEAVATQLKEARKRGAAAMKQKDDLADALLSIEKKARLAVMKDHVGIDELCNSSRDGSKSLEVSEVNKVIYNQKDAEAKPEDEEKNVAHGTGLGTWETIPSYDTGTDDIDPSELPETESYVVKEKSYEVKTCSVIESVDIEPDNKTTGFKKRRAKNLRKRTDG